MTVDSSAADDASVASSASLLAPPSSEEMVAIVAAVEGSWPRAVVAVEAEDDTPAWRFSGRWWARPVNVRRQRPYVR